MLPSWEIKTEYKGCEIICDDEIIMEPYTICRPIWCKTQSGGFNLPGEIC